MSKSIVLAAFNGEKYIYDQIVSLLAYLDDDDEIIVSDDGSSDGTRTVVAQVADLRVKLLPASPRVGYQKNFERAIASSSGSFIFFSDQDDICLPARFECSIKGLQTHCLVAGDVEVVDESLNTTAESYFAQRSISSFSAISLFFRPKVIGATIAVRRDFLEYARPFPSQIPHDQWLSILAALNGMLFVSRKPFIRYRRHANVVTHWGGANRRSLVAVFIERLRLLFALLKKIVVIGFWRPNDER